MTQRYRWTCPECSNGFSTESKESFDRRLGDGCPICQRRELLDAKARGADLRFPTTMSEPEKHNAG